MEALFARVAKLVILLLIVNLSTQCIIWIHSVYISYFKIVQLITVATLDTKLNKGPT